MGPGQAGFWGCFSQDWHVDFPLTLKGSWDVPVLNCKLAHSMPLTCVSTPNEELGSPSLTTFLKPMRPTARALLGSLCYSKRCSVVFHALP